MPVGEGLLDGAVGFVLVDVDAVDQVTTRRHPGVQRVLPMVTSITVDHGFLNFVDIEEAYEISEDDFNKLEMSIWRNVCLGLFPTF